MPKISSFYGIVIMMYWREHNPPHFHAKYGDDEVLIGINDCSILNGWLPPRAMALVIEWAVIYKEELIKNWERGTQELSFNKIEPLK